MKLYQRIKADMQTVIDISGLENLKTLYRNKGNNRLAWDVFWASPNSRAHANGLYSIGFDDPKLETLLIRICRELDLTTTTNIAA